MSGENCDLRKTERGFRVKRIETYIAINAEQSQKFKVREQGCRVGRHCLREQTLPLKAEKKQELKHSAQNITECCVGRGNNIPVVVP